MYAAVAGVQQRSLVTRDPAFCSIQKFDVQQVNCDT